MFQKCRFFDFLKVVLELFRSCLSIFFGLKRLTLLVYFEFEFLLWGPAVAINTRKNRWFLIVLVVVVGWWGGGVVVEALRGQNFDVKI